VFKQLAAGDGACCSCAASERSDASDDAYCRQKHTAASCKINYVDVELATTSAITYSKTMTVEENNISDSEKLFFAACRRFLSTSKTQIPEQSQR